MAIAAGILAILFALLHLGFAALSAGALTQLRSMSPAFSPVGGTSVAQGGIFTVLLLNLTYAISLISAAIGLFRQRVWGWILALTCAGVASLVGFYTAYGYIKTTQTFRALEKIGPSGFRAAQSAIQGHLHTQFIGALILYFGYAIVSAVLLMNRRTSEAYRYY